MKQLVVVKHNSPQAPIADSSSTKRGQFFICMHNEALTAGQDEEDGTVSGQL